MATIRRRHASEAGFSLVELLVTMAILGLMMAAVLGIYTVTQRSMLIATAAEDAQSVARSTLDRLLTDLRLINAGRGTPSGAILAGSSATSIVFLGDVDNDTLDAFGNDATLAAAAAAGAKTVTVSSATGFSVNEWFSVANGATSETQLITGVAGTTLTLGAGLTNSYPVGSIVRSVETVTYAWDPASGALCRNVGGLCVVPFPNNLTIATIATNPPGFQLFTYWTSWNGPIPPAQITDLSTQLNRDLIREIRVTITGQARMGDQTRARTMSASVRPRNF